MRRSINTPSPVESSSGKTPIFVGTEKLCEPNDTPITKLDQSRQSKQKPQPSANISSLIAVEKLEMMHVSGTPTPTKPSHQIDNYISDEEGSTRDPAASFPSEYTDFDCDTFAACKDKDLFKILDTTTFVSVPESVTGRYMYDALYASQKSYNVKSRKGTYYVLWTAGNGIRIAKEPVSSCFEFVQFEYEEGSQELLDQLNQLLLAPPRLNLDKALVEDTEARCLQFMHEYHRKAAPQFSFVAYIDTQRTQTMVNNRLTEIEEAFAALGPVFRRHNYDPFIAECQIQFLEQWDVSSVTVNRFADQLWKTPSRILQLEEWARHQKLAYTFETMTQTFLAVVSTVASGGLHNIANVLSPKSRLTFWEGIMKNGVMSTVLKMLHLQSAVLEDDPAWMDYTAKSLARLADDILHFQVISTSTIPSSEPIRPFSLWIFDSFDLIMKGKFVCGDIRPEVSMMAASDGGEDMSR